MPAMTKVKDGTTAVEMVAQWLNAEGYDGLCCPWAECGCGIDDLCCCDVAGNLHTCVAAYQGVDENGDVMYYTARDDAELSRQ